MLSIVKYRFKTLRTVRYISQTLNPEFYRSKKFFNLEKKQLFNKNWLPIAYTNELDDNKIICKKFGKTEIIVTKTKGNEIKAFYNTCRHRASRLVRNNCNSNIIVCPYHLWKYSTDGRLLKTPRFDDPEFEKCKNGLFEIKSDTFKNIICINFDNNCSNIYEHYGGVYDDIKDYPLEDCKIVRTKKYKINANWKLLIDNFLEYYHLPSIHPELVKISGMNEHVDTQKEGKYIGFKTDPLTNYGSPIDTNLMKPLPGIGNDNKIGHFHALYPNMFYFLLPNHFFSVIIEPISATKSIEHATLFVHKTQDETGNQIEKIWEYMDNVNKEDIGICEEVQKGINCREFKTGFYVTKYEKTLKRFHNFINEDIKKCL